MQPASRIGHGRLGVRSLMRGLDELIEQSASAKHAYVDLQAGQVVPGPWATSGSNTYSVTYAPTHPVEGHQLDVVGVQTEAGDTLIRAERLLTVQNNQNVYWFDEATNTLWVHLTSNADPNSMTILALLNLKFASVGSIEPTLGTERITDGSFDVSTWATTTTLTNWFEDNVAATGVVISQDTTFFYEGDASVRIGPGASGLDAGFTGGVRASAQIAILGALYRLSGWYRTSIDLPSTGHAALIVDYTLAGGNPMLDDGRNMQASATIRLQPTLGEWRRFIYDWRSPLLATNVQVSCVLLNAGGVALTAGFVNFDSVSNRRIWRMEFCEPRLDRTSVPPMEIGAGDIYFGSEEVGLGTLKLLNQEETDGDDGYLETLLGAFDYISRRAQFTHGGAFGNGQEVTFENALPGFSGTVDSLEVDDAVATLPLQDTRALMSVELPLRTYTLTSYPEMNPDDAGRPLPYVWGSVEKARPTRIAGNHPDGGSSITYHCVDTINHPDGVKEITQIHIYTSAEAAAADDPNERRTLSLSGNPNASDDVAAGTVTLFAFVKAIRVVAGVNDRLDFVCNATPVVAELTPGVYQYAGSGGVGSVYLAMVEAAMEAAAPPADTFTLSYNSGAVTIARTGAGTFELQPESGANVARSGWADLGFTDDQTGSATGYTGSAIYSAADVDLTFHVRVDIDGYKDDSSGTYTGTASALIEKGPDILRNALRRILRRPASEIDSSSFNGGRTSTPAVLGAYVGGQAAVSGGGSFTTTLQEFVDRLEASCHTDVVMDGQGVWYWRPRPTSALAVTLAAATAPTLTDRDFLAFRSRKGAEDVYSTIRLNYDQNPATGVVKGAEAHLEAIVLQHGSQRTRVFDTYLKDFFDAGEQAWNLMLLAVLPRRMLEFTVKGRLLRKLVSDLVKVQRTRMLPAELATMLNADVFRILRLRFDPQTFTTDVVAYTADLPRNGDEPGVLGAILEDPAPAVPWFPPMERGIFSDPGFTGGLV